MFKPTRIQQLVAIATLAAALPLAAQAQGKDPVRVALITSKSGGFATMGADVANGIRFAVEEANARGGVDGRRVIVAEGDDESTPDAGRRAASIRPRQLAAPDAATQAASTTRSAPWASPEPISPLIRSRA